MSRKRKQPSTNLLSPHIFLSSVAKLNIHPQRLVPSTLSSKKSPNDIGDDGVNKHGTMDNNGNSFYESNHNNNSTMTSGRNTYQSDTTIQKEETTRIVCTNEAMEILRICHGQFISLIASELASGARGNETNKHIRNSKLKKKLMKEEKQDDNDCFDREMSSSEARVRSILPQHVMDALENLEFNHIIVSDVKSRMELCSSNQQKIIEKKDDNSKERKTITNNNEQHRKKKQKLKKALKNSSMTADLLEEQEKLFAMSVEKAKKLSNKK